MGNLLLALLLAGHGLIHLGYVSPSPADPNYPFRLNQSWLISSIGMDAAGVRTLGTGLTILTVIGFVLVGLSTAGFIVPQGWWLSLTVVSAILSLALLIIFWHPWLVIGIVIDLVLLAALMWLGWQPFNAASV